MSRRSPSSSQYAASLAESTHNEPDASAAALPSVRVLLLGPRFFDYELDISQELQRQGFEVSSADERPSNAPIVRAILRTAPRIAAPIVKRYYQRLLSAYKDIRFAVVIVIKGEVVPSWFLAALRTTSPDARFVLYLYDSIGNSSRFLDILDCFDAAYSFDRHDVASVSQLAYLPLFYANDFVSVGPAPSHPTPLSFVGTIHSDRYLYLSRIQTRRGGTSDEIFLYSPARWYFALMKILSPAYRRVPWSAVSFSPITRADVADIFRRSHAVLDIHHPGQSGLSPRVFEILATGAILVTTNQSVRHEPFYDPSRVVILPPIDQLDVEALDQTLLTLGRPSGPPEGLEEYSIDKWVQHIVRGV